MRNFSKSIVLAIICLSLSINLSLSSWITDSTVNSYKDYMETVVNIKDSDTSINNFRYSIFNIYEEIISKLVDQLESTLERGCKDTNELKRIANYLITDFQNIIKKAYPTAIKATGTSTSINNQVMTAVNSDINSLTEKLFKDLTQILNSVDKTSHSLACDSTSSVDTIIDEVIKNLPSNFDPFTPCRIELDKIYPGIRWTLVTGMTREQLFAFRKCIILEDLNQTTPLSLILTQYQEYLKLSGDFRCLSFSQQKENDQVLYLNHMAHSAHFIEVIKENIKTLKFLADIE